MTDIKKLIGAIVVCGLLSACGKKDQAAPAAAAAPVNVVNSTYQNSGNTVSFSTWEGFKQAVNDGKFVPVVGFHEVYKYGTCSTDKGTFLGFIPTYSTSCSQKFEVNIMGGTISGGSYGTTEDQVKTQLKALVNAASGASNSYMILSSTAVQFVSGSYIYIINLGYPAAANPIYKKSISSPTNNYFLYDVNSFGF